jgi:hypothetical protein
VAVARHPRSCDRRLRRELDESSPMIGILLSFLTGFSFGTVEVDLSMQSCNITVSLQSTQRDFRSAEALCKSTGMPTVFYVSSR